MRLYTANSPNSLKVQMALAELGVNCEREILQLTEREYLMDDLKAIDPQQKVPILETDGTKIAESGAIIQYLGRTSGSGLWPANPVEDAELSQWLFFESVHLALPCGAIWWSDTLAPRRGVNVFSDARLEQAVNDLKRPLDVLNERLSSKDFIADSGFTLADCVLGVTVSMLKNTRMNSNERWPRVAAYAERVRARGGWARGGGDCCMHWTD